MLSCIVVYVSALMYVLHVKNKFGHSNQVDQIM